MTLGLASFVHPASSLGLSSSLAYFLGIWVGALVEAGTEVEVWVGWGVGGVEWSGGGGGGVRSLRAEATPPESPRSPLLEHSPLRLPGPSLEIAQGTQIRSPLTEPFQPGPEAGDPMSGWSITTQLVAHLGLVVYL